MKKTEFPGLRLNKFKINNKGQIAIESVLLMVILVGVFAALTKYARDKKLLSELIQKPMQSLSIMAGFGVWKSADATIGCRAPGSSAGVSIGKCHPNSIARSLSSDPQ